MVPYFTQFLPYCPASETQHREQAHLQVLVSLPVVPEVARGEELGDEVDAGPLLVMPGAVALDDVGVVKIDALNYGRCVPDRKLIA